MSISYLKQIREIIEKSKLRNKNYKIWNHNQIEQTQISQLPFKVGKDVWNAVLFPDQIALRMGSNKKPSLFLKLITNNNKLVYDNRITLIGPDLSEIDDNLTEEIGFCIICLISGKNIEESQAYSIRNSCYISNEIFGFIQRGSIKKEQFLLSKELKRLQISIEDIGISLLYLIKNRLSQKIDNIELIFLTNSLETIEKLSLINREIKNSYMESMKFKYPNYLKLRDDCDFDWECSICSYKNVCEEIRKIKDLRSKT